MSDSSLETKMIRLYQKGFEIRSAGKSYSRLKNEVLGESNNSEIEHVWFLHWCFIVLRKVNRRIL